MVQYEIQIINDSIAMMGEIIRTLAGMLLLKILLKLHALLHQCKNCANALMNTYIFEGFFEFWIFT